MRWRIARVKVTQRFYFKVIVSGVLKIKERKKKQKYKHLSRSFIDITRFFNGVKKESYQI